MADQTHVQHLRGDTAKNDAFTGAVGELTIDTQVKTVRMHDGVKVGGYPLVSTVNNQTITGVKTFVSSPEVPTVSDTDDSSTKVANTAFVQGVVAGLSGGGVYNTREILTTSGTYTAPASGWYKVICIGGGGGGGSSVKGGTYGAGGAGASGAVVSRYIFLDKSREVNYIVGSGGTGGAANARASGTAGGKTTFLSCEADGGEGGGYGNTGWWTYPQTGTMGGEFGPGVGSTGGGTLPSALPSRGANGGSNIYCSGGTGTFGAAGAPTAGYGGGGGGGGTYSTADSIGGNGANGAVILEYYDPTKTA